MESNSAELDMNALPPVFVNGQNMPLPGSTWPYRPIFSGPPSPHVGYISFHPSPQAWQCPGCKTYYAPGVQSCTCSRTSRSWSSAHPQSQQHVACDCRKTAPVFGGEG
jgi:hypothetical protein